MHLVGNPGFPRRNLWGGLILVTLAAFQLGFESRGQWLASPDRRPVDPMVIALAALMLVAGVLQFRLGLRRIAPTQPSASVQSTI